MPLTNLSEGKSRAAFRELSLPLRAPPNLQLPPLLLCTALSLVVAGLFFVVVVGCFDCLFVFSFCVWDDEQMLVQEQTFIQHDLN